MHTAGTTGDHAKWSGRGAFLEVGAAVRTLVARLVTGRQESSPARPPEQTDCPRHEPGSHRRVNQAGGTTR
jgi:hypothetical protein